MPGRLIRAASRGSEKSETEETDALLNGARLERDGGSHASTSLRTTLEMGRVKPSLMRVKVIFPIGLHSASTLR